ncbi:MAG: serine/threonine protein phosphatase [Bacillota bacterium]|nr:serine/threonine protein phosphatase [Bacillota bacterium]
MRKNSIEFKTGFTSEAGTYRTNKDFFAYVELDDIACYIAADGIDSDEEVRSAELAVNSFFECFMEKPTMSRRKIKNYIMEVHKTLIGNSTSVRLKASMIILVTDYTNMIWAVAGNARLYFFRNGGYSFRSKDQSVTQMMVDAGKVSEEECNFHDERNNLTSFMGQAKGFKPYISKKVKLSDGDSAILCTSGFWENIDNLDLVDALKEGKEPNEVICELEDIFLSRQNKVINNYTLAALFMNKVYKEGPKQDKRIKMAKKIGMILVPIIIVASIGLVVRSVHKKNLANDAIAYEKDGDKKLKDKVYNDAMKAYENAEDAVKNLKKQDDIDRVDKKYSILQNIIEGDELFAKQDFENAKKSYNNALSYLKFMVEYDESSFDKEDLKLDIQSKLEDTKKCLQVLDLSAQGDKEAENENYKGAIGLYKSGKTLASDINYADMEDKLSKKIDEAEGKLKDAAAASDGKAKEDKQFKKLIEDIKSDRKDVDDFIKEGDKLAEAKAYEKAIIRYNSAIDGCKKIEDLLGSDDNKPFKDRKEIKELKELKDLKDVKTKLDDKIIDLEKLSEDEKNKEQGSPKPSGH